MCTLLCTILKISVNHVYGMRDHIFVTTIFPEFIWLTKWKSSGHAHSSCVAKFYNF